MLYFTGLAKPAQKKNANAANRGGYIDTFIETGSFDSSANGRR